MTQKSGATKATRGVQFPHGSSSTDIAKTALAASTTVMDPDAAERIIIDRDWRYNYNKHLVKNCALLAEGQAERSVGMAVAGLKSLRESLVFLSDERGVETLTHAMSQVPDLVPSQGGFRSVAVRGSRANEVPGPLRVPYKDSLLERGGLEEQLQLWLQRGLIQEDACQALSAVAEQETLDLSGQSFVVMGAAAEMCPTATLLEHGATVYAIELARPQVWRRLMRMAQASRGTLVAPVRSQGAGMQDGITELLGEGWSEDEFCEAAGCNLLEETPSIAAWICAQSKGRQLCLCNYVYLDGANFVRVSAAADAVVESVCGLRPDSAVSCASSPTECYVVPEACFKEGERRLTKPPSGQLNRLWYTPLRTASKDRYLSPVKPGATVTTETGESLLLRDDYVWTQGPNYAFAKHIQRWRMLLVRSKGHTASANLGPMTLTKSILSNSLIAAGVKGATHFGLEPFYAVTSSTLLAALLVHDLTCKSSAANPDTPLISPLLLFSENALHVGAWNSAFHTNSYTEVCALTFAAGKAQPYVAAAVLAAAGFAGWQRLSKL